MVSARDAAITGIIASFSLMLIFTVGNVNLSGSQTQNLLCKIPVVHGSSYCQTQSPSSEYRVTFNVELDRLGFNKVKYKTVGESRPSLSVLSNTTDNLAFPAETRDAKLEYVLRTKDGVIKATDTRRFGTVVGGETRKILLDGYNLESGTYELYMEFSGTGCGLISCSELTDTYRKQVKIPALPLGEYKSLEVNP